VLHQRRVHRYASSLADSDETVESKTLDWIKNIIVGLNLCPFAERPLREKLIKIDVVRDTDEETVLTLILAELLLRQDTPGTTLVVCPELHPDDFLAYLDFVNMIEQGLMVDHDLAGDVQVAPFHPLFEFEGSESSIDNWTNRSPYPTFHILREEEVSIAVDRLDGDASKVWKRNVNLLTALEDKLGTKTLEDMIQGKNDASVTDQVGEILKQFRL
jgi:hypothetical protein